MIYKFKKYERVSQWWRDYYEIEADSKEEAIKMILDCSEEPYDSEILCDDIPEVFETIITDESNEEVYNSNNLKEEK